MRAHSPSRTDGVLHHAPAVRRERGDRFSYRIVERSVEASGCQGDSTPHDFASCRARKAASVAWTSNAAPLRREAIDGLGPSLRRAEPENRHGLLNGHSLCAWDRVCVRRRARTRTPASRAGAVASPTHSRGARCANCACAGRETGTAQTAAPQILPCRQQQRRRAGMIIVAFREGEDDLRGPRERAARSPRWRTRVRALHSNAEHCARAATQTGKQRVSAAARAASVPRARPCDPQPRRTVARPLPARRRSGSAAGGDSAWKTTVSRCDRSRRQRARLATSGVRIAPSIAKIRERCVPGPARLVFRAVERSRPGQPALREPRPPRVRMLARRSARRSTGPAPRAIGVRRQRIDGA